MPESLPKLYINSKRAQYIGVSILCIFIFVREMSSEKRTFYNAITSTLGVIVILILLYSLYKIFFGRHIIIFKESEFKIQGYDWVSWNELVGVYPFDETDFENGTQSYLRFRLKDGRDLSIRSENLEMNFEQVAYLVNKYRDNFQRILSKESA
jgi:hypothetical protein